MLMTITGITMIVKHALMTLVNGSQPLTMGRMMIVFVRGSDFI